MVVVLPAYNAGKTLEQNYQEIPFDIADEVILTDDKSSYSFDETSSINFRRSSIYGLGVLKVSIQYMLNKAGLLKKTYLRNK